MRILIVNTSAATGGAAIAASRLKQALADNGHEVKMMVADRDVADAGVVSAQTPLTRRICFLWERLVVFMHLCTRRGLFDIDPAVAGSDITGTKEFREADVVHLHWINQGMLSLSAIRRILSSGKPVVVTLHDMWNMTGLCHYAHDCQRWRTEECRHCPLHGCREWAHRVWQRKRQTLGSGNPVFVGCSQWMAQMARESGLLGRYKVMAIPNAIDPRIFNASGARALETPDYGRLDLAGKRIILFVAQKVTDPRKGMPLLIKALQMVDSRDTVVAVLGGKAETLQGQIPQQLIPLGYQAEPEQIAAIYRSASVFVTPSLSDNLPNTIMEAMACGVPCVGYGVGGIPEMIDHRVNGYVASPSSVEDLAAGIRDALEHRSAYSAAAIEKVRSAYHPDRVAEMYLQAYTAALAQAKR